MGYKSKEALIEEILIANYEKYYHMAFRYVKNDADALDIVQEGAYKAILKCDSLKNTEFAETWVYRIMLNEVYGLCRKHSPEFCEISEIEGESEALNVEGLDLKKAISKLSKEEQTILEMRYYKDMKLTEVAEVLDTNLSTVKSKLYRAIEKLRMDLV